MNYQKWMERALYLANLGRANVSPNPMVGCVIVCNETIIGEGYHEFYGGAHAEVNAINAVKDKTLLPYSTVFVTLEPCSHFGKTPPCANLLIKHSVNKVVIAAKDPNPLVQGKGIEKLQNAGIDIAYGILENEAIGLNIRFFTSQLKKRPYIILKWAETQNGCIARDNFDSKWISNALSRKIVHQWRSQEDAILVGKNTAIFDNPRLNVRDWSGKSPTRILLDSYLETPTTHYVFDKSQKTIVFNTVFSQFTDNLAFVQMEKLDLNTIVAYLHKQNILSVIIEGGASVIKSFIKQNIWDEARVFVAENNFQNGIEAPKLAINPFLTEKIKNDTLNWYKNVTASI
jgi:diaminohydroxyphosphoribosylaminopyrimidine deaminase / 5-amino-6-(5-phosphoribosylamino)uracil reductase